MAKMAWNTFASSYKTPHGFLAAVSASLAKNPRFDKNNQRLPTPYGLFQEWLAQNLNGDWASIKMQGGFIICVADQTDAKLIVNKFGTVGVAKKTSACASTIQIGYQDHKYGVLARDLGYSI